MTGPQFDESIREGRPRVLSGIQPTSDSFHLGNYLGALQNWVSLQEEFDAFYCVVDLHAITVDWDPKELRERSRLSAAQLLAIGLDPDRCALFIQSHVPEHAELACAMQPLQRELPTVRQADLDERERDGRRHALRGGRYLCGAPRYRCD